jgi:signal peptidase I
MAEPTFRKSTAREYFESIVVAVILALFIRTFAVQAFKIPTGSMEPNLLVGDHLLVNKFVFAPAATPLERMVLPMRDVRRGDIVVFKFPEEPERDFIKRVIGLPGDTIEVRNRQVFVNGSKLDEPYAHYLFPVSDDETESGDVRARYGPVTVPTGHYFMMGDNRDNSQDSRYWGFLPAHYVKGRALMIYWSFESPAGEQADGAGGLLRGFTSIFTGTRWSRLPIRSIEDDHPTADRGARRQRFRPCGDGRLALLRVQGFGRTRDALPARHRDRPPPADSRTGGRATDPARRRGCRRGAAR